jgi:RNA polymerase sigma factor (sigma-70 family)
MKDQELLSELKLGRENAFKAIYREHFGMIRYLVVKNSGSDEDAADVFQEGLMALYEAVRKPNFQLTASLKTFLYSICRNLWLKRLRAKGRDKLVDFEKPIQLPEVEIDPDPTESQLRILRRCLDQIGESCRALLERYYYLNQSMEEIATQLGYSNADTAKTQKYKCLQRLKKLAEAA